MDKTTVKVEFEVTGELLLPDLFSKKIDLIPVESWIKGEKITGKELLRKRTLWLIDTGEYEESYDINDQIEKMLDKISSKKEVLIELKKKYKLEYQFSIVINIENNEKPAIYFQRKFIEFSYDIAAEFNIDLYIYS